MSRRALALVVVAVLLAGALGVGVTWVTMRDDRGDEANRCYKVKEAARSLEQQVRDDTAAATAYASGRTMYPSTGPLFQQTPAYGPDKPEWERLRQTATRNARTWFQVISDSPECFDPEDVALARTMMMDISPTG